MSGITQSTLFDFSDTSVFPKSDAVLQAIEKLASESNVESRGAIFTRREIVDFILDLIGYTTNECLFKKNNS